MRGVPLWERAQVRLWDNLIFIGALTGCALFDAGSGFGWW